MIYIHGLSDHKGQVTIKGSQVVYGDFIYKLVMQVIIRISMNI